MKVSPPRGMRDFFPRDLYRRESLIKTIREVYERYGYEPIETPVMENLEVLLGKGGEEQEKLLFKIMKRGEKLAEARGNPETGALADLGLRYDLTVPLARFIASHAAEIPPIFRRYHIGPVWRADRPQDGRFREFFQCDIDAVGSKSTLIETEVILATWEALQGLNLGEIVIRLSDRRLLPEFFDGFGIDKSLQARLLVSWDKLDKIGSTGVMTEISTFLTDDKQLNQIERLLKFIPQYSEAEDWLNLPPLTPPLPILDKVLPLKKILQDLVAIKHELTSLAGPGLKVKLDASLVRGMAYYTGPIFEIAAPGYGFSLGGGGRADGLIGKFLGRELPLCGFSIGFERILKVLADREASATPRTRVQALVTLGGDETRLPALQAARQLRSQGLKIEVYPDPGSLGKQFKCCEQKGIPWAVVIGPDEVKEGVVSLRAIATRENLKLPLAEAVRRIRDG